MTSTPPEQLAPRLSAARELLLGVPDVLPQIGSAELAELAALTAGVAAAARAAQAAVVLEADQRGVIAESDHPRLPEWVAQSCREADAPVTPSVGRALDRVARVCRGYGLARLREAITGRVPVEAAEQVAASYARLQGRIEVDCWDLILDGLIGWAAEGAVRRDLAQFEETMIGQYGTATEFKEREQLPQRRDFTAFTTGRDGMREARLFLDPDAEALLSAAITALSAPVPSPDGGPDLRTPGMRRADALLALARLATRPEKDTPGTGAKARIVVTIPLIDLLTGLVAVPGFTLPGLTAIPGLTGAGLSGAGLGGSLLNSDSSRLTGSTDADTGTGNSGHGVDPTGVARIGHTGATGTSAQPQNRPGSANQPNPSGCNGRTAAQHGHFGHPGGSGRARCGITGLGQTLTPGQVRVLACDAQIIPAVLGSRGEILDLGRGKRLATPALVTYLWQRDKGCSYPRCTMPPAFCDAHHLIHWLLGGPTNRNNMALLCQRHHTTVHQYGHVGVVTPDGVRWRRNDGTPISNQPRAAA